MQRKLMVSNVTIICRKTQENKTTDSLMRSPKMRLMMEDTQQQQENISRPPKKSTFIEGDSMIKKWMVIYLPVLLIINTL